MKNIAVIFLALFSMLLGAEEIDFLKLDTGQKATSPSGDLTMRSMLSPYRDGFLWKVPKGRTEASSGVVKLGTVPLLPLHNYRFHWELMPAQFQKILIRVNYIDKDGTRQMANTLGTFENSSAFAELDRPVFTPPNITSGDFELVLFGRNLKSETNLGYIKSIKLLDDGPQKSSAQLEGLYGKNLLPFSEFSSFKPGPVERSALKMMNFGQKPFATSIVEENGQRFLRINYKKGDYQYATWFAPEMNTYGMAGEISCRLKGKGRVQIMLWYNRPSFPTVYFHYGYFDLTEDWKDYKVGFGCNDPLTQKLGFSISFRDVETELDMQSMRLDLQANDAKPAQESKAQPAAAPKGIAVAIAKTAQEGKKQEAPAPAPAPGAKPEWADNKLGYEALSPDYIDPDFAPLVINGKTIVSGHKKMSLDAFGLPTNISYRDFKITNGPARLEASGQAGKLALKPGKLDINKFGKNNVKGHSTFQAGDVVFAVDTTFEFDFTVICRITATPVKKAATLNNVRLVFPMGTVPSEEKLVMYYTEGPNKPENGIQAQNRRKHLTLKGGDFNVISPGFCSLFWIGTTNWGLSWNFETAQEWNPIKGKELTFTPENGEYAIEFIGKETVIDKPRQWYFYLTPTPMRTPPKNWRAWNYGWRGTPTQKFNYKTLPVNQLIWWSSTWTAAGYNPLMIRNPEAVKEAAKMDAGMHKGNYYIPQLETTGAIWTSLTDNKSYYWEDPYLEALCQKYRRTAGGSGYGAKTLDVPEGAQRLASLEERNKVIGQDDSGTLRKKFKTTMRTHDVVFAPPVADHMVWALNEFCKMGVGGIYYDGINPQATYNDWAAWTDPDGVKRPKFHFEYQRQLLKRMRQVVKKHDPGEIIIAHQSGTRPASTLSLCDAILPGETFFYWYHDPEKGDASPNGDFYYAHIVGDIDNLKGEFFHRQWGYPHILLPECRGRDRQIFKSTRSVRTMLSYTLHFDMLYFPTMCQVSEIYKIYRIRDAYGMADTDQYLVEFHPYWENKAFISDSKDVKISYYDHAKQQDLYTSFDITKDYMVIVSNLQFDDSEISFSLPKNLKKAKVVEMQSNREMQITDGKVRDKLIAYDFAIYRVTGEMDASGHW
ncbi:MAG: hypothetical protein J5746_09720 [Victivallales bacterium]|nr:hypothetical protein [Victivallales bacterium]